MTGTAFSCKVCNNTNPAVVGGKKFEVCVCVGSSFFVWLFLHFNDDQVLGGRLQEK